MVRLTPIDIKSLPAEELRERLAEKAIPAFRARQIQDWLDKGVSDFAQMVQSPAGSAGGIVTNFYDSLCQN